MKQKYNVCWTQNKRCISVETFYETEIQRLFWVQQRLYSKIDHVINETNNTVVNGLSMSEISLERV